MKNKNIPTFLLPAAAAIILLGGLLTPAHGETYSKEYAVITYSSATSPIGYFLLVRKGNSACAIRFTDYESTNGTYGSSFLGGFSDADPNTGNNEQTELRAYVEYDYFNQNDGSGNFQKENVSIGHAKLTRGSYRSTISAQRKASLIRCGSLELHWSVPTTIAFFQGIKPQDEGIELAPTKWRDVADININDPKIIWYHFDETRMQIAMPIEDLW